MSKINVLYATDTNYMPHAAASIYSLLDKNRDAQQIKIFIIDDNISEDAKSKLANMVSSFSNASVVFHPFSLIKPKLGIKETWFASVGYARLMISDITTDDKILYIDCDTIINGSLEELWNTDIENYYVAGVLDNPIVAAREKVEISADDNYINSGVLLINLKKWREDNIEEKIVDMINRHNGFVVHHDQGIINGVCNKAIKILHPKFNTMSQFYLMNANQIKSLYKIKNYYHNHELEEAISNPVIVHYISKFYYRPWFSNCSHPKKNIYLENLEKTPFTVEFKDFLPLKQVKIRKFIFEHFPFFVFFIVERILDIRRNILIRKQ